MKIVYHLYVVFAEKRDQLLEYCHKKNIEVKIHYTIPLYQQEALKFLSYPKGSFPVTDYHSKNIITFPVDQHLTKEEQNYVIKTVKEFYEKK